MGSDALFVDGVIVIDTTIGTTLGRSLSSSNFSRQDLRFRMIRKAYRPVRPRPTRFPVHKITPPAAKYPS